MCDLESHCLHLYYSCPRRDSEAQTARATVIRVEDNEVNYLLANRALQITIPFGYAAKTTSICGPFEENVMPNKLLACGVEGCEHGAGQWYDDDDCFYYYKK